MPCLFKPDMHHTWLCIMPCLCDGCLPCCLLLSGVAFLDSSRLRCDCEDPFDYVRLPSPWTRSSSLRDLRQDDHTLEITTIFAMLVCSLFAMPMLRRLPFACQPPKLPCQTSTFLANGCLAMLPLCSAPLIALFIAGEVEDCSILEHVYVGISQYLLF